MFKKDVAGRSWENEKPKDQTSKSVHNIVQNLSQPNAIGIYVFYIILLLPTI